MEDNNKNVIILGMVNVKHIAVQTIWNNRSGRPTPIEEESSRLDNNIKL